MKIASLVAVLFPASAIAVQEQAKRQEDPEATPTAKPNYDRISSALNAFAGDMSVTPLFPSPTVTLGLSIPESLRAQIMTAVPMSVVVKLVGDVEYRESVASEFQAGNTPQWFEDLEPGIKTFFQGMAAEIRTGDAVVTRSTTSVATATGSADGESDEAEETNSEDPAMPTGVNNKVLAGAVGMAGALGAVLAL